MDNVVTFNELPIVNSIVRDLFIEPYHRVALEVAIIDEKEDLMEFFELRFCRVLYFSMNIESDKDYGTITSTSVSSESFYLLNILKYSRTNYVQKSPFYHFSLEMTSGLLDIVAEEFTFSLFKVLPIHGSCDTC